jgi:zinc protease
MGTGHDNYAKAREGMLAEIRRLGETAPSAEEVEIAQNTIWGSGLTASLSRMTQAYEMGVDEFLGLGYDFSERMAAAVRSVTPEEVRVVAKRWFDPDNYVLATVGKLE